MKTLTTRRTALALFLVVFGVYQFPLIYDLGYKPFFTWAPGIDIASNTLLPLALLQKGDWTLNQFQDFAKQNYRDAYFLAEVKGRTVSRYPVAAAVLALPAYGVPLATGWIADSGYPWLPYPWTAFMVAKFAAAAMAALAALMFFFCARELTDLRASAALDLVFAFGTSVWSTASQGLWQQTPSILLQLIGIWFVLRGRRLGAMAVAPGAFFFSAATVTRQNNALPALLFTLYILIEYRAALWRWIAWAIPPALLAMGYNAVYNGSPLVFGYQEGLQQTMGLPRLDSMVGLLLSPSRGLLVYSPFFVVALLGWRNASNVRDRRFYLFAALTFASSILFLSMFQAWDGGWGYGTRLLTDGLPYAMLLLIPAASRLQGLGRATFWGMVGYAVVLQSFGLWDYGVRWHWHWENSAFDVWDLGRNEPLFYLKEYVAMAQRFLAR
ncbi:MAG: hypothetical protein HY782_20780 [Chloroflexi bacterium]|nr:hypothetical protein [Chloroflexota bacterium]